MKNEYENSKNSIKSYTKTFDANKAKLEDLLKKLEDYKKNNKWMKDDPGMKQRYDEEISRMETEVNNQRNYCKGDLKSLLSAMEKSNKIILPYVQQTDERAQLRHKLDSERLKNIDIEINKLQDEKDKIPEDIKNYTSEGKQKAQEIEEKIKALNKEKEEKIKNLEFYYDRQEILADYKNNINMANAYRKLSEKLGIKLEAEKQYDSRLTEEQIDELKANGIEPGDDEYKRYLKSVGIQPVQQGQQQQGQQQQGQQQQGQQQQGQQQQGQQQQERNLSIQVGRNVSMKYKNKDGKTTYFGIGSRDLKDVIGKIDRDEKLEMIKEILTKEGETFDADLENKIKHEIDRFDDTIIYTLSEAHSVEDADDLKDISKKAMQAYSTMILENKKIDGMDINYDRKDLSKVHLRSLPVIRYFTGQMSRSQKDYINEMSEKSSNFTTSTGIYQKNPIKRFMEERKQKKMPAPRSGEYKLSEISRDFKLREDPDKGRTPEEIEAENAIKAARQGEYNKINEVKEPGDR